MTLTQTLDIPADRRVRFDIEVPREVTADKAFVTIRFPTPAEAQRKAEPKAAGKKINMTREELDEFLRNSHTPISDSLVGILSDIGDIDLDEIRMERLSKHLK
jgi:hypothetical protein